ncbi:MAG: N-acetylmuramic acid 6-phosphate etherase [Hyphomicrobium sp.]|jgi:N-acetylmuramic acid 6-phosphate etherase
MNTEELSPRYADIDLWPPADILDAMIEGQLASVAAVREARASIERAALAIEDRLRKHGRLVYVGAGTSGRLAVQDGAELMPTFSWPADRLLLLLAGGDAAMTQAIEGAEDDTQRAIERISEHAIGPADVLIAVAASGTTPFTHACLREASRRGALTVGIANNPGTPLLTDADCPILLATGPEPIAGSTRMNAGTAQRITLSLLSTLVMIRLGRIYRGMMVEVQACNAKLAKRRERMVAHLTGHNGAPVHEALERADGSVKLAVLLLQGYELSEAQAVLDHVGGRLRAALDHLAKAHTPSLADENTPSR